MKNGLARIVWTTSVLKKGMHSEGFSPAAAEDRVDVYGASSGNKAYLLLKNDPIQNTSGSSDGHFIASKRKISETNDDKLGDFISSQVRN